jgi:putative ABC transport system permease protein
MKSLDSLTMRSGLLQGETWRLAWDALRTNKVRAVLTMLGVIIGSACIVLVVTVALAGKKYIIGQIEGVGANLIYAEATGGASSKLPSDEISMGDLEAVRQGIPEVVEVAGTHDIEMTVAANGREHPVNLVGVTEGFQAIRNLQVLQGRYFDGDEMKLRSKVCLLTRDLASVVFPAGDALGKEIRIGELHFTVIGIFQERVATFGQSEITRESLIIPFSLMKYYTGEDFFRTFYAQADNPDDVPLVTNEVAEILRNRHRPEAKYLVQNLTGILEAARNISLALTLVLLLVAFIALAVSGIGIMNIMLVTVTERTREIGIRKAIGARQTDILYQFLLEALLISGTGALIGIFLAVLIPALINFGIRFFPDLGNISVPLSWISVVVALLVSCSTGVIFGYLPANRAAKLHPTESLRYE